MSDREFSPWLQETDVRSTVQFVARLMSEEEADFYRKIVSHRSDARKLLVSVRSELKAIQAMPLVQVMKLRSEKSLRGEVASEWLEVSSHSLLTLARTKSAQARFSLAELVKGVAGGTTKSSILRMILAPKPRLALAPAHTRSDTSPRFDISAEVDKNGTLSILVRVNSELSESLEGKDIEVAMQVEVPVILGSGRLHQGRLSLKLEDVGVLLGRAVGSDLGSEMSVQIASEATQSSWILPLDETESLFEHPTLVSPLILNDQVLTASIRFAAEMITALQRKDIKIFGMLAPGQWQLLDVIRLSAGQSEYELKVELTNVPDVNGHVLIGLRYEI